MLLSNGLEGLAYVSCLITKQLVVQAVQNEFSTFFIHGFVSLVNVYVFKVTQNTDWPS